MYNIIKSKYVHMICKAKLSIKSDEVLIKQTNNCGIITLNRPNALNSLNKNMVDIIYPILSLWATDKNVTHVIIDGVGEKAFCAGGDIRQVTDKSKSDLNDAMLFFRNEYKLNHLIGSLNKPYIALLDGITMGGGIGLSVQGRYRVATQRTLFAMPETAIGFFPDVGGSYFLPRLKGNLGMYLGLLGTRLKGEDVVSAGIATHYMDSQKIAGLKNDLINVNNPKDVERVIHRYADPVDENSFSLTSQLQWINHHFSPSSIEEILKSLSLSANSASPDDETKWSKLQLDTLKKMSPTSLKITCRQLSLGKTMTFREVFTMEYRMSKQCMKGHDFHEGVRALLVDKDKNPRWKPASLEEVTSEIVDEYFRPASDDLVL